MSPRVAKFAVLLAVLLVLAGACGARLGAGEGKWRLVNTRHFALYTDLPREAARNEASELERLLSGFQQAGWETRGELPLRLNVVMFASPWDFGHYGKREVGGYHIEVLFEPWVVLPAARGRSSGLETVAHELTHYMAFQAMPRQPRWFAEGLASYFQTGHFGEDGRFVLGSVPEDLFQALRMHGVIRPSDLIGGRAERDDPRFYPSSWLLVHYLMNEQAEAFQEYQKRLAAGRNDSSSWAEAFPQLPPEQVDVAVGNYLLAGSYARFRVPVQTPAVAVSDKTLTRTDEHALQALLWSSCFHCSKRERARTDEECTLALADDPHHLQASALLIARLLEDPIQAFSKARLLVGKHPDHWLPRVLLAKAAWARGHAFAAGSAEDPAHASSLAPSQAHAWLARGSQEALRGERDNAVASSGRAQRLSPSDLTVLLSRAEILARVMACEPLREVVSLIRAHPHLESLDDDERAELSALAKHCEQQAAGWASGASRID